MNESGTAMSPVMVKLPAGFSFLLSLHYAPVKSLQSLPISPLPLETEYEVRSVLMRPLICAAHSAWLLLSLRENIKHMIIGTSQFLFFCHYRFCILFLAALAAQLEGCWRQTVNRKYQQLLDGRSWCPEDESCWLWSRLGFLSGTTSRFFLHWNISVCMMDRHTSLDLQVISLDASPWLR